ncbi:hypothetical protein GRX03_16120 [Halovenus sp. WSH3]|uniref:Uncharacterized protein n=1 Tax=Halovenus carboxidivorans TaxID=2692199 RepID=A0A6B0TCJ3_9EURY|nr:DUF5799 family protein [Halovenus carboxidivorans]MXR53122.1 hypothetical protein [Halovenus carboxidivorans]
MSNGWRDKLAGARMRVDQEFNEQVIDSQFSNQEWGLIMTAVELDIDRPETPSEATLTANTENLEQIMPELENLPQGMARPGGGGDSGGVIDSLKSVLGFDSSDANGSGVDADELAAATELVEAYAAELQAHLEDQGRWTEVCSAAAAEQ